MKVTKKEKEVLDLIAIGKTSDEAACIMGITPRTVKAHIGHMIDKFDVNNRVHLVAECFRQGIIN